MTKWPVFYKTHLATLIDINMRMVETNIEGFESLQKGVPLSPNKLNKSNHTPILRVAILGKNSTHFERIEKY